IFVVTCFTLFPYTTLFRSDHDLYFTSDNGVFSKKMIDYGSRVLLNAIELDESKVKLLDVGCGYGTFGISLKKVYPFLEVDMVDRSEEHTSELQSRFDLVCR